MPLVKYITKIILIVSMLILDHSLLYGLATTGMEKNLNTMTGGILHTCICMDTPHSIDKCCCTLKVNTSHDYTYIESSCSGSGGTGFLFNSKYSRPVYISKGLKS